MVGDWMHRHVVDLDPGDGAVAVGTYEVGLGGHTVLLGRDR
jgi:hypothetical protein